MLNSLDCSVLWALLVISRPCYFIHHLWQKPVLQRRLLILPFSCSLKINQQFTFISPHCLVISATTLLCTQIVVRSYFEGQPASSTDVIQGTLRKYHLVASVRAKSPVCHFTHRTPASGVLPNPEVCCRIQKIHTAQKVIGMQRGTSRIHHADAHIPSLVDIAVLIACPFG